MVEKNEKLMLVSAWIKGLETVDYEDILERYEEEIEDGLCIELTPKLFKCLSCQKLYRFDDIEDCPDCGLLLDYEDDGELFWFPNQLYRLKEEIWIWQHRFEFVKFGFRIYETEEFGVNFGINGEDGDFLVNSWLPLYELYHQNTSKSDGQNNLI